MTTHVWTGPHPKPYRHYQCDGSMTTPNGLKIVSVTQAISILDKPALVNWSASQTCEGVVRLVQRKRYTFPDAGWKLRKDLEAEKLDWRSNRDDAAARGTAIHKVLEDYIGSGHIPAVGSFPQEWRGYIRALSKWLLSSPARFVESEVVVGSVEHGFAGTRDTVAVVQDPTRGRVLYDLKSAKGIYPSSHFRQVAAYELAGVECGEEPTDDQAIVRLGADGEYEVRWLSDGFTLDLCQRAFLNALATFRDEQEFKAGDKR